MGRLKSWCTFFVPCSQSLKYAGVIEDRGVLDWGGACWAVCPPWPARKV